jgi:plasmid maintenance system antidote protein VapI
VPLIERSDLTVEQAIQAIQAAYNARVFHQEISSEAPTALNETDESAWNAPTQPLSSLDIRDEKEGQKATELLLHLTERADISFKEIIQVFETIYKINPASGAPQGLQRLAERSNLTVEQIVQILEVLSKFVASLTSEEKQIAKQLCVRLTQDHTFATIQYLSSVASLLDLEINDNYVFIEEEMPYIFHLLMYFIDIAFSYDLSQLQITDVPPLVNLVQQKIFTNDSRDGPYRALSEMIPQFHKLNSSNEQLAS